MDQTVYELGQELGALQRRLAAAEQEVRQRMDLITAAKEKCVPLSFVHLFIVSLPNICLSVSVLCMLLCVGGSVMHCRVYCTVLSTLGTWLPVGVVSLLKTPLRWRARM